MRDKATVSSFEGRQLRVLEVVPKFKLAGGERMAESLIYGLNDLGVHVEILSLYDYESSITAGFRAANMPYRSLGKRAGFDPSLYSKIREYVRLARPDVVHTHLYSAKYVIPTLHVPTTLCAACLHTVHSVADRELSGADKKLQALFYRRRWATPVAISPQVRETVVSTYGLAEADIPMIRNGVTRSVPETDRCAHEGFTFLHIGRYEPVKNHRLLVEAFSMVRSACAEARLVLLGTGCLFDEVAEQIDRLGLRSCVEQVGEVDDVTPYLGVADAFVLPSEHEGLPITLIEALQAGLPCVCTPVGGVPDIVEDGCNGLFCEEDAASISSQMLRLIRDEALYRELASKTRISASEFSQESMARGYLDLMRRLVSNDV